MVLEDSRGQIMRPNRIFVNFFSFFELTCTQTHTCTETHTIIISDYGNDIAKQTLFLIQDQSKDKGKSI